MSKWATLDLVLHSVTVGRKVSFLITPNDKGVFKYCVSVFRFGGVFKAKLITLLLLGWGLGV